jgi:hypothetical protein
VKNLLTGFLCTCLLVIAGNAPARAQEKKPDPQPIADSFLADAAQKTTADRSLAAAAQKSGVDPAASASTATTDSAQPAAASTPAGDADQQTPAAAPQQTPPAGQTPQTGQTPVPPPAEEQPTGPHSMIAQPPPPPPKVPDVRRPGESGFWVEVEGWLPKQHPYQNGGTKNTDFGNSTFITLQGKPKYAEGLDVGLALGLHNTLHLTLLNFNAVGDYTSPIVVSAWTQTYSGGTYVSTDYHYQRAKLSYEYLTWPFPVGSRKVRLKTLWQVQFTNISTVFDSPLDYYDSNGNLIYDSSGQPINLSGTGTKRIISPEFGLGFSYYPSRHVRFELSGSGFGFPHHYYVWDGDASVNIRVMSHLEIRLGARGLGFKTSTNGDFYIKGNYVAPFAGIRWYSNSE